MTDVKLLTEAEVKVMCGLGVDSTIAALRERGLIAPEPDDPVERVMRLVRDMADDSIIEQAIRELAKRPALTVGMVRKAVQPNVVGNGFNNYSVNYEAILAALQEQLKEAGRG